MSKVVPAIKKKIPLLKFSQFPAERHDFQQVWNKIKFPSDFREWDHTQKHRFFSQYKLPDIISPFSSMSCMRYLMNNPYLRKRYECSFFSFDYYYFAKEDVKLFDDLLTRVLWFYENREQMKVKPLQFLTLQIFAIPIPKRLPHKDEKKILTPEEINSGFTDHNQNQIVIYRKEDMNKVLVHELIHFFELDKNKTGCVQKWVDANLPKVAENVNFATEAYTDFLAIYFESTNFQPKPKEYFQKQFDWTLSRMKLILSFFGHTSLYKFMKERGKFPQTTNVFYYFFVKALFMKHCDEIREIIKEDESKLNGILCKFMVEMKSKEFSDLVDESENKDNESLRMIE